MFDKLGYYSYTPDDPSYVDSWHLQTIDADKAWDITTGIESLPVGIIDCGIKTDISVDLTNNLNYSLSEDCFSNSRNDPFGYGSNTIHGSQVAGVLGAKGDNETDISGVSWYTSLVSLRIDDDFEHVNCIAVADAIDYANISNISILNISLGFCVSSNNNNYYYIDNDDAEYLSDAVSRYNGLLVVSAGNDNVNLDNNNCLVPQIFTHNNIIVVGASDAEDKIAILDPNSLILNQIMALIL